MKPAYPQRHRLGRSLALPVWIRPGHRGWATLLMSRVLGWGALLGLLLVAAPVRGGSNLVVNGSFDSAEMPLGAWQYKYSEKGESWYFENHTRVSVVEMVNGRRGVLRLAVPTQDIADVQGTKVDSAPIPVQPGGLYRMTAWARSTGPNCRLYIEGYKWRPGIKKHPNPTVYELRKCYKFRQLYFGPVEGGTMGGADSTWRSASMTVPEKVKRLAGVQQQKLDEIEFLVIHMIAIGGTVGDLFIDDVVLERVN